MASATSTSRLLAFCDFPAAHWIHLRTTNRSNRPLRQRPPTHRQVSRLRLAIEHFINRVQARAKRKQQWQKLHGAEMIGKVITGIKFRNGVEVQRNDRQKIAA